MRVRRVLLGLVLLVAAGAVILAALAWRSEIEAVPRPDPASFDDEQIFLGSHLAAIGNCVDCHTAPDGPAYAGGYAMNTPYGVIYGTNITPDPETGIGSWSEAAFIRAMREGVDREGRHLYPAFPYDQFNRATDEDLGAIYAYLMSREPVRAEAPTPDVPFPLQFRPLLAGWKLLFLDQETFQPDETRSSQWNRGAYLADGLAHCGGCHTPRNVLGAREEDRYLAGGESEDWHAPALNPDSIAPVPWSAETLFNYLRFGIDENHAVAAGPMAPVVRNLASVPEEDVRAIAIYIASVMGHEAADEGRAASRAMERAFAATEAQVANAVAVNDGRTLQHGETIFAGACGICHGDNGPLLFSASVDLTLASSIEYPDPRNVIRVILDGIEQPLSPGEPLMPGFAAALTDSQVAAVAAFMRTRFSEQPLWEDLEDEVRRIREDRREQQTHFGVAAGDRVEGEE